MEERLKQFLVDEFNLSLKKRVLWGRKKNKYCLQNAKK